MKKVAKIISFLLGPQLWLPVLVILFVFFTGVGSSLEIPLLSLLILFFIVIPFSSIVLAYKTGKVSDLDLTKRTERFKPLFIMFICFLCGLASVFFLANSVLLHLYILFFILFIVNAVITLFWKISFHMTVNVAGAIFINYLFGWRFPWLYLCIPLVFWARYVLKKHTIAQLVGAAALDLIIIITYLRVLHP